MHMNAFISVSEKEGIVEFTRELLGLGFDKILASGGTAKILKDGEVSVMDLALIVGDPILDHRVVTLSRPLHAGLLADLNNPKHMEELAREGINPIHLVCVDFYPLEKEVKRLGATIDSVINQTDIGGPAMARSAAKGKRIVIADPSDRKRVIDWLKAGMPDGIIFRQEMAARAEFLVAKYCLTSARFLSGGKYYGDIQEIP